MASHRGGHPELTASGSGGSWRERSSGTGNTIVINEIPQSQSLISPVNAPSVLQDSVNYVDQKGENPNVAVIESISIA